jgi:hypothetical protein
LQKIILFEQRIAIIERMIWDKCFEHSIFHHTKLTLR